MVANLKALLGRLQNRVTLRRAWRRRHGSVVAQAALELKLELYSRGDGDHKDEGRDDGEVSVLASCLSRGGLVWLVAWVLCLGKSGA